MVAGGCDLEIQQNSKMFEILTRTFKFRLNDQLTTGRLLDAFSTIRRSVVSPVKYGVTNVSQFFL